MNLKSFHLLYLPVSPSATLAASNPYISAGAINLSGLQLIIQASCSLISTYFLSKKQYAH